MRSLAAIIALFYFANTMAAAPYGIKGQGQSGTLYSNVHQFPNNQVTNLGGINALVETGNNNILSNPSFEHQTASSGWVDNGSFTGVENLSSVVHGKKALDFDASIDTINLTQSSTLYASQFADGVQGLAMVRIKSSIALKVCSIQAGVVSTTNCVTTKTDLKWGLYKVPFILGGTSNGISISSGGNTVTGIAIVDDAFVGAQDVKQEVDQSRFYGSWSETGAVNCSRSFSSSSYTILPVDTDCSSPVVSGSITATTTKLLAFNMSAEAGTYQIIPMLSIVNPTTSNVVSCKIVANGISSNEWTRFAREGGFEGYDQPTTFTLTLPTAFNGQFELQCKSSTSSTAISLNTGNMVNSFHVYRLGSGSTYSSNNADTDWASCGHTTSSFTGFGTVSAIETQCKRQGGDLLMKGKFTSGVSMPVEARVALPTWNGTALSSKGSPVIPSIQISGHGNVNTATTTFFSGLTILIEPSVAYFTIGAEASISNGLSKILGNSFANGQIISFDARIPINGWENSNIIIGQFNGLESCKDSYECTDTFSASVSSTGVVSSENIDWISGFCTLTSSVFTCPFKTGVFTVPPVCTFGAGTSEPLVQHSALPSSTGLSVLTRSAGGAFTAGNFQVSCQKSGADYIGKTAKAVASDQNARMPGFTNAVIFGASVNNTCSTSPCVVAQSYGATITGITRNATGSYSMAMNGLTSTPICVFNATETGVGNATVTCNRTSTRSASSYTFHCKNGTALIDYNFEISCMGY